MDQYGFEAGNHFAGGSAKNPGWVDLRRAGWAVFQRVGHGGAECQQAGNCPRRPRPRRPPRGIWDCPICGVDLEQTWSEHCGRCSREVCSECHWPEQNLCAECVTRTTGCLGKEVQHEDYRADCVAVAQGLDGGYDRETAPERAHASIWRVLDAAWESFTGIHKVKGHQAKVEDPATWEQEPALTNRLADEDANKGKGPARHF